MAAPRINPYSPFANVPAHNHADVTPHNDNDLPELSRGLFVGGVGTVACHDSDGNTATYTITNVPFIIPLLCRRVLVTGTSATLIVRMW